jgi:hypothetical protein
MKVLELFAGTKSISNAFIESGHQTFAIDKDPTHSDIDLCIDILEITAADIIERFGRPDIIWASPDCTTYSIAAISHHRTKEKSGNLAPKSDYAKICDQVNLHMLKLIEELQPKYFFIENPMGGFRKMDFIQHIPRFTTTYCRYGDFRMKKTDIFTNHPNPNFLEPCKNNQGCHEAARRGSKTGTQGIKNKIDRSRIPKLLCEHIVEICKKDVTT